MKILLFSISLVGAFLFNRNIFAWVKPAPHHAGYLTAKPGKSTVTKALFGDLAGQPIYQYTLTNSKGMIAKVINYGATITDLITPDKNGIMGEVVLGFDSLKNGYIGRGNAFLGAAIGRLANRIRDKKFTLDGQEYTVGSNLHSGPKGFDKKVWTIEELPGKEAAVKLTCLSADMENGYPGNLNTAIIYTLTNNNELKLTYAATTDKPTPVALTNHSYFNLTGTTDKVTNTEVTILADQYIEADRGLMPTGNLIDVKGTPFDFTKPTPVGKNIATDNAQLKFGAGYDLAYALRNTTGKLALAATAYEPGSGRVMQVYTTEPGLVFYTGNHLSDRTIGRGGKPFTVYGAVCFETMHFPDAPNHANFPSVILRPGETFSSETVYKFSVRK